MHSASLANNLSMDPCDSISEITFYFITYSHAYIKKKLQLFHINLHSGSLSL